MQHIICSHYSPKNSHLSCKQQYVYDKAKDEGVFHWLFLSSKIYRHLQLVSNDLSKFTIKILVANVTCNLELVAWTS